MARSAELRAYSHIFDAALDPDAPLPVTILGPGRFSVASFRVKKTGRRATTRYVVEFLPRGRTSCTCPWFTDPRNETGTCKHVHLVHQALYIRRGLGVPLPPPAEPRSDRPLGGGQRPL